MTSFNASPLVERIERLVSRLTGIVSVRAILDAAEEVQEIHVLATPKIQPKKVVRNVESALRAGLGVEIDRRIVSVAQLSAAEENGALANAGRRVDAAPTGAVPEIPAASVPAPEVGRRPATVSPIGAGGSRHTLGDRVVLAGFDAHGAAPLQAVCRARFRWRGGVLEGMGEGANTVLGRAQAGARAVFSAVTQIPGCEPAGLDGASLVDAHGRTYVVVRGSVGRRRSSVTIAGAAFLTDSPEEAGILASLQAMNRWCSRPADDEG